MTTSRIPHLAVVVMVSASDVPVRPVASNVIDHMGRNIEPTGKKGNNALSRWLHPDLARLFIGERRVHFSRAALNPFGVLPRVMSIAASQLLRIFMRPMIAAVRVFAAPQPIRGVFLRCSPFEVGRRIIELVGVDMCTMKAGFRFRPVERLANKHMGSPLEMATADVKRVHLITVSVDERPQHPAALSTHSPEAGNQIPLGSRYAFPFFSGIKFGSHDRISIAHCGQGRALLTQRFRPVFYNRIALCSQAGGR